jgi:hypothetical protein
MRAGCGAGSESAIPATVTRLLRAVSTGAAAATVVAALFALLSLAAAGRDPAAARERLMPLRASDGLAERMALPLGGRQVPSWDGNDCLVLMMLVVPREGFWRDAFSPRIPRQPEPTGVGAVPPPAKPRCLWLAELLDPAASPDPLVRYDRYLHGQRVVGALLLPAIGPFGLRDGAAALLVAALGSLVLSAGGRAWRRRRAGTEGRWRDAAFAWLALGLLLFQGLPMFGRYWTHALSDLVPALFLWTLYACPPRGEAEGGAGPAWLLGAFGASVALFELLTGGLPLGAALVLMIAASQARPPTLAGALASLAAFGAGAVLPFAAKLLIGLLAFDGMAGDSGGSLLHRLIGPVVPEMAPSEVEAMAALGFDVRRLDTEPWLRLPYAAFRLAYFGFVPGWGSTALGLALLGGSLLGVLLLAWRALRRGAGTEDSRRRAGAILAASAVVPVWYLLFLSHTLLHAVWMVRSLAAWPIAFGLLVLFRPPSTATR